MFRVFARARAHGATVVALETPAEQLALLEGMSDADQEALLANTLRDFPVLGARTVALRDAWRAGDLGIIDSLAVRPMAQWPRAKAALLDDRNARWVPRVEQQLGASTADAPALVVVGAAHLVGARGLVALLAERGYHVVQQ